MLTAAAPSPPLPRPVTPRAHVPPVAVGLVLVALAAAGVLVWASRPPASPATGTAVLVASQNGVQVIAVVDGPEPGRHVVSWADGIPVGEPFTVGLAGPCGCDPRPATIVRSGRTLLDWALAVTGGGLVIAAALMAALSAHTLRRTRAAQRAAAAVVGTGSGPVVHVLPFWTKVGQALVAEVWPVDGTAPIGRVHLGAAGRGFDPTRPFRAWGPLRTGEPIALTSEDGRQLVLPLRPLDPPDPPGPPGPISHAAGTVLGWPSRIGPGGEADLAAVDAAVDRTQARSRVVLGVGLAGMAVVVAVAVLPLAPVASIALVGGTILASSVVVVINGDIHGPVQDLVAPVVGPGQPRLVRQAEQAVLNARRPRPADPDAPHGRGAAADGAR